MAKDKILTEDEIKRKETLKKRLFWILVCVDALLVVYLVIQVFLIVKS